MITQVALLTIAALLLSLSAWHTYMHDQITHRKIGGIHFVQVGNWTASISKRSNNTN